jgi:phage terminase small subunit
MTIPKAPRGLSRRSQRLWRDVLRDFDLGSHEQALLEESLRALDRADEARAALDAAGLTYLDRFGSPKARPEVAVERDSRGLFVRTLRELGLDPGAVDSRPPRIANRYDD